MTEVSTSIEIAAPADKAWEMIGGFGNLPLWLCLIRTSTLEDGGRVRRLEAVGGAIIVERLLHFDEAARRFRYNHLEAPNPVTGYEAEMFVEPVDDRHCRVVWASRFTPAGISEADAIAHFEGIYTVGLHGLKGQLEG